MQHHLRIYFTASIAAKDKYLSNYRKIVQILESKGHEVVSEHIMSETESHIRMKSREDRLGFHAQLEKWIHSCDFIIAETSFPSISVGYEISLALHVGKPVLVLYSEGDPPSLLAIHKDDKLVCEKYQPDSLESTITDFLHYMQGKSDLRFTFFITPRIATYLEDVSKKEKLPKSVYLRKLIEQDMEKI